MKIRHQYFIILAILLILSGLLLYYSAEERSWQFYAIEVFIVAALVFLISFYRGVVRPLRTIAGGIDLLRMQDFNSRLRKVGQYETDRIIDVFNPLMDKLKNERLRLREQNHFLDLVLNASPLGVIVLDGKGNVTLCNPAASSLMDGNIAGRRLDSLTGAMAEALRALPAGSNKVVRMGAAGIYRISHLSFIDNGYSHPFFLIETLSAEVYAAEKEAYRKAIRMVVHEVNNSIGGIMAILDTVADEAERNGDNCGAETARECIARTGDMLSFIGRFAEAARIPQPVLRPANPVSTVLANRNFLESICTELGVRLICEISPNKWPESSMIDEALMAQALINIIKNAAESASGCGRSDPEVLIQANAADRTITISDNGTGIPAEVASKLFSPFFSTKPGGQGIGLILIREILSMHNLHFSLATDATDGLTKFKIGPFAENRANG